jgi:hypothetical protein
MRNRRAALAAIIAGAATALLPSGRVEAQTLETLDVIGPYLDICVIRRMKGAAFAPGREVTLRLSFRSDGTIIGVPRATYSRPSRDEPEQARLIAAVQQAFVDCTPLPFSKPLGASIAGRIFTFRYTLESNKDERA